MTKRTPHGTRVNELVYRIIIKYGNNNESSGSGFFVSKEKFVTCFHVVFGQELRQIRTTPEFNIIPQAPEHEKLKTLYSNKTPNVLIELDNGIRVPAKLDEFSEFYDIATLSVEVGNNEINTCKVNTKFIPSYGDIVTFGGFPSQFGYNHDTAPFAYAEGVVSSFPSIIIGGENYEHIKINAINLSGNSGSPLFLKEKDTVIGIINGNMNWGRDDIIASQPIINGQMGFLPVSFRVPLSIAYATPLKLIKEQVGLI